MVPDHLRPTFPNGRALMPPVDAAGGTVQVSETAKGNISLTFIQAEPAIQAATVLAENLARRLAEQILFLVDGTVIIARDVGRG